MSSDDVRKILEELFPAPPGKDGSKSATPKVPELLAALRADLTAKYPGLNADGILEQARKDAIARSDRIEAGTPAIRLLPPEVVGPPGGLADPCCFPPDEPGGPERKTSGWFASHAFRIARMHREGGGLCEQLLSADGEAPELVRKVRARLRKVFDKDAEKSGDALQNALVRVLKKAGMFDCPMEFTPWFLTLLSHEITDIRRAGGRLSFWGTDEAGKLECGTQTREQRVGPANDSREGQLRQLLDSWCLRLIEAGIELTPEILKLAARDLLRAEEKYALDEAQRLPDGDPWEPAPTAVAREAEILRRRYREEVVKRIKKSKSGAEFSREVVAIAADYRSAARDCVPMSQFELIVALANHNDYTQAIPEGDPARVELRSIRDDIEALLALQEESDRGEKSKAGELIAGHGGGLGPIERLARIQVRGWGLVRHPADQGPVWNAARNLRWLGTLLEAASTLAACLRHAERLENRALDPLVAELRRQRCLRSFRREVREVLEPHAVALDDCPPVPSSPDDAEGATLLKLALGLARVQAERRSAAAAVAGPLPLVDWRWWISRVTNQGTERADDAVRKLAVRAGLAPPSRQIP